MPPDNAIASRERPRNFCRVAEGILHSARAEVCYESFTVNSLFARGSVATFARVMTEAFTNISRGAGAAVRALRGNHRSPQFSACNLLFFTANRQLTSANFLPLTSEI